MRKYSRLLVALAAFCFVLAGVLVWYLVTPGAEEGRAGAPDQTRANAPSSGSPKDARSPAAAATDDAEQIAQTLKQTITKLKASRAQVIVSKEKYIREGCPNVTKLQEKLNPGEALSASRRIATAEGCNDYINDFNDYHNNLEKFAEVTSQLDQLPSQVDALNAAVHNVPPAADSTGGLSWTSLLWVVVASIVTSLAIFLFITGKRLLDQGNVVAALTSGFSAMRTSLEGLQNTLSASALPEAAGGGAEGQRFEPDQGAKRATQLSNALSDEVRQGFSNIHESLRPVLSKLDKYLLGLVKQSDQQRGAAAASSETPRPPAPAGDSHSAPPPMTVSKYKTTFGVVDCVNPGYKTGYLEKSDGGELSIFKDERAEKFYLIPNREWLQTPSYFHQKYAAYYDALNLQAGSIEVTSPAIVRPEGAQWCLERKGTLTIKRLS
ncbi:MAG TPA: hypothetical protein VN256_06875 [Pyrinomonadaceae bacterium]|nr:hypothetical protein [Pyrinomonadaceae bacterium]